jgi:hypothetical protein
MLRIVEMADQQFLGQGEWPRQSPPRNFDVVRQLLVNARCHFRGRFDCVHLSSSLA